jgi:hypothetical protein
MAQIQKNMNQNTPSMVSALAGTAQPLCCGQFVQLLLMRPGMRCGYMQPVWGEQLANLHGRLMAVCSPPQAACS